MKIKEERRSPEIVNLNSLAAGTVFREEETGDVWIVTNEKDCDDIKCVNLKTGNTENWFKDSSVGLVSAEVIIRY